MERLMEALDDAAVAGAGTTGSSAGASAPEAII